MSDVEQVEQALAEVEEIQEEPQETQEPQGTLKSGEPTNVQNAVYKIS